MLAEPTVAGFDVVRGEGARCSAAREQRPSCWSEYVAEVIRAGETEAKHWQVKLCAPLERALPTRKHTLMVAFVGTLPPNCNERALEDLGSSGDSFAHT